MERQVITNRQLMFLTSIFMFGSTPLKLPSAVATLADRDSWISIILAGALGLAFLWLYMSLGELYPGKTLIESILLALGKPAGIAVCIFYIFNTLVTATQVVWYVGDFFTTVYTPESSPFPINAMFVVVMVIALLYGVEAAGRSGEIISVILYPLFIFSMVLVLPKVKPNNLLPVMENGMLPVIKGTLPIFTYSIWPLIFVNMIYTANIQNIKQAKRSVFLGYLIGILTVFISVIMCMLVLGSTATADIRFPLFWLTNEINVGTIFSRIEAVMLFIWLTSNFMSTLFYYYTAVKGLSQLLKVNNYKRLVIPMGIIIAAFSDIIYDNVPYQIRWDSHVWPPSFAVLGLILPVVILITALIRKKVQKKPARKASQ